MRPNAADFSGLHTHRSGAAWLFASAAFAGITLAGCQSTSKPLDFEPMVPRFLMEAPAEAPGALVVELPVSKVRVPVYSHPVMAEADIGNVELVKVDLGLCLMFDCTPDGTRNLLRLSASNLGRRIVVTLNGAPFGARVFDGPIHDGRLFMFVEMSDPQITAAAVDLKRTVQEVQSARARGKGNSK
jgi:hypothetical protein